MDVKRSRLHADCTKSSLRLYIHGMTQQPRVTLRTIAEKTGLTRMAVSLALRGKPGVSDETRRIVLRAAQQLDYAPDPELAKLMSHLGRRTPGPIHDCLALLTSGPSAQAWKNSNTESKFIAGAIERARAYGYRVEEFWMDAPALTPSRLTTILWNRGIEGILVAPLVGRPWTPEGRTLPYDFARFSVVQISETVVTPPLNGAVHDQYSSMLQVIDQLQVLGYKRPGLILERALDLRVNRRWAAAYLQRRDLASAGPFAPPLILDRPDLVRFKRWFDRYQPDVLISLNQFALGMLDKLKRQIPRDVGYASLDLDGEAGRHLSGIDQNCHLVGATAIDMLVGAIHRGQTGLPLHPVRTLVAGTWVNGTSTPDPAADPASRRAPGPAQARTR